MKLYLILLTFFYIHLTNGQSFNLKIQSKIDNQSKTIDSITYQRHHENVASILITVKKFDSTLIYNGYINNTLIEQKKINDSSFVFYYDLGTKISTLNIYTGNIIKEQKLFLQIEKDTVLLPINKIESWLSDKLKILENNGFALAKVQLKNHNFKENKLFADLSIETNEKRFVDELVILGIDNFPKNIKKRFEKKIKKQLFNKNLVKNIYEDFNEFPFVNQIKYPEILFTKNSTKIYTYLEKTQPNKFDGFIGFANDDKNKLVFNGYLHLALLNIINSGEKFTLYWKNDGNKQTSFNITLETPYLFKTPLGIKSELKIFKQDSLFQNTQSNINLGYYFSFNKKAFIGFQNTTSVDIQNTNSTFINSYKNIFYTSSFEYLKRDSKNLLFPNKTLANIKGGTGIRTVEENTNNQFFFQVAFSHIFYLNKKNSIYIKNESYYLQSDEYIANELYRFGGINSIRGFRENSLQSNFYSALMTEYRYLLTESLYTYSIIDYGYFEDKTANTKNKLLGIGLGFGLQTNNGLFNIIYSNGSTENQEIKLSNSIFQMSFKTNF